MKAQPKTRGSNNGAKSKSVKRSVHQFRPTQAKRVRPLAPKQCVDIIEQRNDGLVVLDQDWRYVYVNQKAMVVLQRQKPADLIGKHIWTEYLEGVGKPFQCAYEKAMQQQIPMVFEDHYEPWELWCENRIYPSPDSLLILFTEITDRIFHPQDQERIARYHRNWRQAREGDIREIEFQVRSKSGEWPWLYSREAVFGRDEAGERSKFWVLRTTSRNRKSRKRPCAKVKKNSPRSSMPAQSH